MNFSTRLRETEIGTICEDWDLVSIEDIKADKKFAIVDGPFGTQLHSNEYIDSGVPVVRVINLSFNGRFIPDELVYISEEKFEELNRSAIYPGDIVVAKTGATIGKLAIFPTAYSHGLLASSCLKLTLDGVKANSRYVFYFLMSRRGQIQIKNLAYGSTRNTINLTPFSEIKLPLPPLYEQEAIAHILGSIDDKIELNRQMTQTLEAIAEALFKSWFVDFEPFRDQGMEDSQLGPIPRGWRVDRLSKTCDITMGQSPPGDTYNELGDGVPFYQGIKDFGFRFPNHRIYCTEPTRFADIGDVLLSVRAPVGSLNMASEPCAIGRGLAALRHKRKQKGYLYYLLRATQRGWEKFDSEGTVFGCITKTDIHDFRVVMPLESIIDRFEDLAHPFDDRIANNEVESSNLAILRDTLLPKLLSGEIRVKDAGKFREEKL